MRAVLTPEALTSGATTPTTDADEVELMPDHLLRSYASTLRNHVSELEHELSRLHKRVAKLETCTCYGEVLPSPIPRFDPSSAANVRLVRRLEELETKLAVEINKHQETQQDRAELRILCAKAKGRIEELRTREEILEKKISDQQLEICSLKAKIEEHEAEILRMRQSTEYGGLALDDTVLEVSPEAIMGFGENDMD